jgi:hypothetical protein
MDDRELLELAAKAGGIAGEYRAGLGICPPELSQLHKFWWNPLTDDGDALRLAAGLCLNVLSSEACVVAEDEKGVECIEYFYGPEDYTSGWRRAIVRAAASIGEALCRT